MKSKGQIRELLSQLIGEVKPGHNYMHILVPLEERVLKIGVFSLADGTEIVIGLVKGERTIEFNRKFLPKGELVPDSYINSLYSLMLAVSFRAEM